MNNVLVNMSFGIKKTEKARTCVTYKYILNIYPDLLLFLIYTGDKILVEAKQYDTHWCIGLMLSKLSVHDPKSYRGKNMLDRLLGGIRDEVCG